MEEGGDFRCWDELLPDALGLIFRNLSLEEVLTVVPRVCKSWGRAVMGPYCWQEIALRNGAGSITDPKISIECSKCWSQEAVVRSASFVSRA